MLLRDVDVANFLIQQAEKKGIFLNHTKLQKVLYIVYGLYLAQFKTIPFSGSPLYLPYGPVFDAVLNKYRNKPIQYNLPDKNISVDEKLSNVMDVTLEVFGKYSAMSLSDWSHREGTAWKKADNDGRPYGYQLDIMEVFNEFSPMLKKK